MGNSGSRMIRLQQSQQLLRSQPLPGQHLTHHPVHPRLGDPRQIFPPNLLQTQQEGPGLQAQGHMMMPTHPGGGSRTRPDPRRSSPSRTQFRCATLSRTRKPGAPTKCPRERWKGSRITTTCLTSDAWGSMSEGGKTFSFERCSSLARTQICTRARNATL